MRPPERSLTRPAAIWLRPALWTQTNRTSGCSFASSPCAWASACSRSRANRCDEQRDVGRDPRPPEQVARLLDVARDRLGREDPCELFVQLLRCLLDLVARDRVERLGHRLLLEIDGGRCPHLCQWHRPLSISLNVKRSPRSPPTARRSSKTRSARLTRSASPALLKVLAEPARLRLLSLIQAQPDGEACVCHLTAPLGLSPADCQPSPQGPARGRPRRTRAARQLGLLPRQTRAARSHPRRSRLAPHLPALTSSIGFTIADGRIAEIDLVADPDKLRGLSRA